MVPLQHPPLHWPPAEQLLVHVPPLQAVPAGQSVGPEHPHTPLTHAEPFALPVQSTHAEADPHAVDDVPAMHVPAAPPQQEPAPQPPPSHPLVQTPPTQVGVAAPHAMQAVPAEPHAVVELPATHVVPLQHPP